MKKPKPYNTDEDPLPKASELCEVYGRNATANDSGVIASFDKDRDTMYDKLKTEADAIYGVKDYYTPEEYFGKLMYIVNGYYDNLPNKELITK